ncbi:MAG: tRNA pseudouridine(55) synthase TruB [Desulfobacterales bacterium]|nr:tRNA pseudouridine(55) synthase TruB [Desulfobacterales bacterium]
MANESDGVIVIDKPVNITSAKVVAIVKQALNAKKVGHTGTLDPFATGVLICCINRATRIARFFLNGDKKYKAVLHLGVETDTQDSTGTITETCDKINFSKNNIQSVCKQFEGEIEQLPPIFSALKHKGIPLYKLARSGKPLQKPARPVFISYIKICKINLPFIDIEVSCSAGTYIRTLCADIGSALGCGGHLKALRRIESCGFTINEAMTLPEFKQLALSQKISERILNMASALRNVPQYFADHTLTKKILHGHVITKADMMPTKINISNSFIKIIDVNQKLIAVLSDQKGSDRYNYCCVFN